MQTVRLSIFITKMCSLYWPACQKLFLFLTVGHVLGMFMLLTWVNLLRFVQTFQIQLFHFTYSASLFNHILFQCSALLSLRDWSWCWKMLFQRMSSTDPWCTGLLFPFLYQYKVLGSASKTAPFSLPSLMSELLCFFHRVLIKNLCSAPQQVQFLRLSHITLAFCFHYHCLHFGFKLHLLKSIF